MTRISLWQDRHPPAAATANHAVEGHYDVAVVGAGITGLVTALLFGRAGLSVAVIEAGHVGAGTTGRTTAKVSCLQGTRLSAISRKHSADVVASYVEAQQEGLAWLARFCADHGVRVERRDAVTFAHGTDGEHQLRTEHEAARKAGLGVHWDDQLPLPFPTRGGLRLEGQLQLDPLDLLLALTGQATAHGVRIFEHARVTRLAGSRPVRLTATTGTATANQVVLATNMPIADRGAFFARMEPERSYIAAFRTAHAGLDAMYLSADQPSRSLRDAPDGDSPLLLVGGAGHRVGAAVDTEARLEELRSWTRRYWPDAVETHAWSAQDYRPHHELPFAGPLVPGSPILIAGGYSKWGMTNAVAAALALSGRVLEGHMQWAQVFGTWKRHELAGLPTMALLNGEVGWEMARGWTGALAGRSLRQNGLTRVCTHLGGVVRWNEAERSWDCPLHGSRFDEDGSVLEGPAVCGLRGSADRQAPSPGRS